MFKLKLHIQCISEYENKCSILSNPGKVYALIVCIN